jgi:hypothetical protein
MNDTKGFWTQLGEFLDAQSARRQSAQTQTSNQPRHSQHILRWLIPNGGTLIIVALLLITQSLWARPFAASNAPGPSATTVNYQGRLADDAGVPLTGTYGMSFALYDAAEGGTLIWGPESHTAVPVTDGLFSVGLGSQTSGGIPTTTWNGDRYLEITVGGETLAPRELIRSVPIAGMALTVPDGAIGSAQIADEAVNAAKLADAAIPVFSASTTETYWTSPVCDGTSRLISGLAIDVTVDDPSTLFVNFTGLGHHSEADGAIYTRIFVDGISIKTDSGKALTLGLTSTLIIA